MRPGVNIGLMNGQLGIQPPSDNGTAFVVIASPAAPTAGYGTAFVITSIADAKAAFANVLNATVLNAFVKGFYGQAAEGNKVYVLCMAAATTLTTLADPANAEKALKLAAGAARLGAFIKYPSGSYTPTVTNGFDADVHTAVTAVQTLANTWFGKKQPFRAFIEGYACDGIHGNALDYSIANNRNCFIVAGEVNGDSGMATMIALGRAVASAPQQNIGRIKSGSLNIDAAYAVTCGGNNVNTIAEATLEGYYTKRYITLEPNKSAAGYVFTDDIALCAPTDDYYCLAYGRVIDNMVRIAFNTYYKELKNDVDVDEDGRIAKVEEIALQDAIENAVDVQMASQLSKNRDGSAAISALVNPDTTAFAALYAANGIQNPNLNIIQTSTMYLFAKARPKGCLRDIEVFLGYTSTN